MAIQVSTVASESAFSGAGRVVDPHRNRLDPEMVQALICAKDWIHAASKGNIFLNSSIYLSHIIFLTDQSEVQCCVVFILIF